MSETRNAWSSIIQIKQPLIRPSGSHCHLWMDNSISFTNVENTLFRQIIYDNSLLIIEVLRRTYTFTHRFFLKHFSFCFTFDGSTIDARHKVFQQIIHIILYHHLKIYLVLECVYSWKKLSFLKLAKVVLDGTHLQFIPNVLT